MKNAKQVVVLFQSEPRCNKVFATLQPLAFSKVVSADSLYDLQTILDSDTDLLVLCAVPPVSLQLCIASVRNMIGAGGIIVVTEADSPYEVAELLAAGADVALTSLSDPTDLFAWKTALKRRAERLLHAYSTPRISALSSHSSSSSVPESLPSSQPAIWRLVDSGWRLRSPDGQDLALTYSEKFFLEGFMGQMDKRLSREELLEKNAIENPSSRAIDSLVSRLRRKAQDCGLTLPIKSVHGWGYSFVGMLLGEHEALPKTSATERAIAIHPHWVSREHIEEQIYTDRFEFMFCPVVRADTESYVGAKATLMWRNDRGEQELADVFYKDFLRLDAVEPLFKYVLANLKKDLCAWQNDYDLAIPVCVVIPAAVLIQGYPYLIETEAQLEPDHLHIMVDEVGAEVEWEQLIPIMQQLQKRGHQVWWGDPIQNLPVSVEQELPVTGLSLQQSHFMLENSQSFDQVALQDAVRHAQGLGWQVWLETVSSVECKAIAKQLGIDLMSGEAVSLPLSRDGLLLAWASRSSSN